MKYIYSFIQLGKEEMPDIWKESIIVPIYMKDAKSGISLLSVTYKIISCILLASLSPCIDEIIEDHRRAFKHSR
jgi:hypothetical protein